MVEEISESPAVRKQIHFLLVTCPMSWTHFPYRAMCRDMGLPELVAPKSPGDPQTTKEAIKMKGPAIERIPLRYEGGRRRTRYMEGYREREVYT